MDNKKYFSNRVCYWECQKATKLVPSRNGSGFVYLWESLWLGKYMVELES